MWSIAFRSSNNGCVAPRRNPARSYYLYSASKTHRGHFSFLRRTFSRSSNNTPSPLSLYCFSSSVPFTVLTRASTRATMHKSQQLTGAPASKIQLRGHAGHSHGHGHHHHHHDNTYLTSVNKNDAGVKVTRLGLYVNLGMALSKGVGGYVFNSQALIADAFHALTDLVSDFMTLATISVALKPPTSQYPNGFGKVESFGSLVVSGLLLTGGILMCAHSGSAILHQIFGENLHLVEHAHDAASHSHGILGHSHSHSAKDMIPNLNAAWLAGGSIIVKEYLYRITMKIAKERKSSILASNAVHHRIDSLTSIVALVAIGGSHILDGAAWLDPVGGLIVALMVIQAGFGNTMASIYELCDAAIDEELRGSVARAVGKALQSKSVELRHVQGTKAGQSFLLDIELAVPADCNITTMREVEDRVREKVASSIRGARRVRVRFVPRGQENAKFSDEFVGADMQSSNTLESEDGLQLQLQRESVAHEATSTSLDSNKNSEKRS